MRIVVAVELLSGTYDASDVEDREHPEWPPHPARLFCAMVAAARAGDERSALLWLERQPPPLVYAAGRAEPQRRSGFVVTNEVTTKPGSQAYPARTNGLRVRSRAAPAMPSVRLVWPGVDAPPGVVGALDAITRRIPYLGRSTGIVLVSAAVENPDADPTPSMVAPALGQDASGAAADAGAAWSVYEPCDLLDARATLRVPYAGYLEQLDAQFEAGRPAWEVGRFHGYRVREAAPAADAGPGLLPSAYTDFVVFRFAGLRPDGRLAARFTEALRARVLRAAGRTAPAALHGHGADGRPHVAFLALPHVGQEHADGHLLGVAVAVPELPDDERRAVLGAVLGLRRSDLPGVADLPVPGIGSVELSYQPGPLRPWGATPQRWRRDARRWATATPVVLDRYPKKKHREAEEVVRSCRLLGLPDPVDIQVSSEPLTPGGVRLRPVDLPAQVRGRLFRHVSVEFDRRVSGPLLLGAGRYLGVGLLAPIPAERAG
jgi:CRISPR-associated protein Csb2